ncbi:MAG TPA: hypothetical protein VHL59_05040, partial [Thermoanaerobaculia bacterium]|nr:hypothetical protein [Thermoanaerobaculia bacterium]
AERRLDRPTIPMRPAKAAREARSRMPFIAIAAALLLALTIAAWMLTRDRAVAPPQTKPGSVPVAAARLGINAFPWAEVTSIRNLDNGQSIDMPSKLLTPAPVDLPPGRYEVTFTNPNFAEPITRTISVPAGGEELLNVHFSDPERAKLPDFGGAR